MTLKEIILHLRFPFSFFLSPVFFLAISQQKEGDLIKNIFMFFILHILVYPSSNAYNSYCDKDEDSIGLLKNPPKVDRKLLFVSNLLDIGAICLSIVWIHLYFAIGIMLYILISRAYSWDKIRLKKYPILSWLIVGIFQGGFISFLTQMFGQSTFPSDSLLEILKTIDHHQIWCIVFSIFMLLSIYPITQIYQHDSDKKAGINTISMVMGIRGTFVNTMIMYSLVIVFAHFFMNIYELYLLLVFSIPMLVFLIYWIKRAWSKAENANFENTMRMNVISSVFLNSCFIIYNFI
ncbi:MAG: UbiA family prenyltransferase [Leadbetterella sp.]